MSDAPSCAVIQPHREAEQTLLEAMNAAHRRMWAYARRAAWNPADIEELIADAWAAVWCDMYDGQTTDSCEASAFIHLRASCRVWIASRRREVAWDHTIDVEFSPAKDMAEALAEERFITSLSKWIEMLPECQRQAIQLRYQHGLTLGEVAVRMGCSLSAAKTHYYRALRTLRARVTSSRM